MTASNVVDFKRDWRVGLKMEKGVPAAEAGNAFLMLTNGEWQGCIAYDEFADRTYWAKAPPRPPGLDGFVPPKLGEDVADHHQVYVQHYLSLMGLKQADSIVSPVLFRIEALGSAIDAAARKNSRHPLREYLNGLQWDETDRLSRWCHECLGAELNPYTSAVGTWWMISAVARALQPGCQADHMLLLEGEQGARKSTALRILAGDWYLPELPDIRSPDAARVLHGRWIVECGELSALKRSGVTNESIKDFVSRMIDIYRKPYGKSFIRRPRSVVFAATTNDYQSLSDPTGARRYWPVKCTEVDSRKLSNWRDQLWAEAVCRFQLGEQWHPTAALSETIKAEQEERYQDDSYEDMVLTWASKQMFGFTLREALSSLTLTPDKWTKPVETRVGNILNRAGYRCSRVTIDGRRVRQYARPTASIVTSLASDEEESDFPDDAP